MFYMILYLKRKEKRREETPTWLLLEVYSSIPGIVTVALCLSSQKLNIILSNPPMSCDHMQIPIFWD